MNMPQDDSRSTSFQTIVLWVRFTGVLARSPVALTVFSALVRELLVTMDIGGILLDDGTDVVLGLEGRGADVNAITETLRSSRYVDIVVACKASVNERGYRSATLARPDLTTSERAWLRLEIESGFRNLDTLPTLMEWLALRQFDLEPSLQSDRLVSGQTPSAADVSAQILKFRMR